MQFADPSNAHVLVDARPLRPFSRQASLCCLLVTALPLVCAADPTQPDGQWHGALSIGGSASSGSSHNRVFTGKADVSRETTEDKAQGHLLINSGSSRVNGVNNTTADLFRLGGRLDHNLSQRWFSFTGAEAETDKVQGLESRWALNAGLGYKLLRLQNTSLDVFSGLGYTHNEYRTGDNRSGPELTFGEELTHDLAQNAQIKQRLVLFPAVGDNGARGALDVSLVTKLLGAWTTNIGWAYRYTSDVPVGASKTDSLLTLGVGYSF